MTTSLIDNNNLTSSSGSIEMKETLNDNESEISNKQEMNENVNVHFHLRQEASPSGQIAYKMVPIAQNEVIVTNFNGSNQNHILANNDNDSKILSNLETPVYFMVQTPELVQTNKLITKSNSSSNKIYANNSNNTKTVRDERRRANHNEVERRRRDNINKWIVELSKVIPDCSTDHTKHGQSLSLQSKGGILEKTVQYLIDIKLANEHLNEHIKSLKNIEIENELLRKENEKYVKENQFLRLQLEKKLSSTN